MCKDGATAEGAVTAAQGRGSLWGRLTQGPKLGTPHPGFRGGRRPGGLSQERDFAGSGSAGYLAHTEPEKLVLSSRHIGRFSPDRQAHPEPGDREEEEEATSHTCKCCHAQAVLLD